MTPDKTNTQPDPVKLVKDFAQAIAELTAASGRSGSDAYLQPFRDRAHAVKAALLDEFTRLAALRPAPSPQGADIGGRSTGAERAAIQSALHGYTIRVNEGPDRFIEEIVSILRPKNMSAPTPSETLTAPAPYYPQGMIKEYDAAGKLTRTANPEFYKITRREEWTDQAPKGTEPPAQPHPADHKFVADSAEGESMCGICGWEAPNAEG